MNQTAITTGDWRPEGITDKGEKSPGGLWEQHTSVRLMSPFS